MHDLLVRGGTGPMRTSSVPSSHRCHQLSSLPKPAGSPVELLSGWTGFEGDKTVYIETSVMQPPWDQENVLRLERWSEQIVLFQYVGNLWD